MILKPHSIFNIFLPSRLLASSFVRAIFVGCFFSAFAFLLILLCSLPVFSYSSVTVIPLAGKSELHHNSKTIKALLTNNNNFFFSDLDVLRASIERLPWVSHVDLRREFPNQLFVVMSEYQAVAKWKNTNKLVSSNGVLFEGTSKLTLPILYVPEELIAKSLHDLQLANNELHSLNTTLKSITINDFNSYSIELANGTIVYLGRAEPASLVNYKIKELVTLYPQMQKVPGVTLESIDFRYEHGISVKKIKQESVKNKQL